MPKKTKAVIAIEEIGEAAVPIEKITSKIFLIRGEKIMLDRDLAELYSVETRTLNQAVARKIEIFPSDFLFTLIRDEIIGISQIVISSKMKFSKNVRAFTGQGLAMHPTMTTDNKQLTVQLKNRILKKVRPNTEREAIKIEKSKVSFANWKK